MVKASLVAQPLTDRFFTMAVPASRADRGRCRRMPNFVFMRGEGVFGSAELVPMTPKLGQYFGTENGLLVVRAPDDSRLKLEDGDVIVDIDGRTPASPSHALRILSSYQPGEKLKLNVLRAKKRMSFEITVPDEPTWREAHRRRALRATDFARTGSAIRSACLRMRRHSGTFTGSGPGFRVDGPGPDFAMPGAAVAATAACSLPCAPHAARRLRLRPARRSDCTAAPARAVGGPLAACWSADGALHDLQFTDLPRCCAPATCWCSTTRA